MKSILVLTLLTTLAGGTLATVHRVTQPHIDQNNRQEQLERLRGLTPPLNEKELCKHGIELRRTEVRGYSGKIEIVVAFEHGDLLGIRAVLHSETPGYARVLEPNDWLGEFADQPLGSIDAITRATVTTNAVLNAVRDAVDTFESSLDDC